MPKLAPLEIPLFGTFLYSQKSKRPSENFSGLVAGALHIRLREINFKSSLISISIV